MHSDRHRARICQLCGDAGLDVSEATFHGRTLDLCPGCNRRVAFGSVSLDEIDPDETLPDPSLDVDVPVATLDRLPPKRREDYEAVVLGGAEAPDRATERGVQVATVRNNVRYARDQLSELATQVSAQ